MSEINHIGISTYLFFETIKNLMILLSIMFVVFSIYSVGTNLAAAEGYRSADLGYI